MAIIALAGRARWPATRRELGHIALAGTLVQGVQFLGVYGGIKLGVPAAISSLVIGVGPVLTALLARPVLGERTTRLQRWGFALGVAGVVLAVSQGLHVSSHAFAGLGLTLRPARAQRRHRLPEAFLSRHGPAQRPDGAAAGLDGPHRRLQLRVRTVSHERSATLVVSVAWLALVNSIGAVSLLYLMVRRDHAGRASTMFFLVPSVTAVLAAVILHEPLELPVIAGFTIDGALRSGPEALPENPQPRSAA
ncbi:DMT family transporter [Amycolatopsis sp. cmx-8-4]|uniref:DMT family transporter n=1 Tax=Amycolatopsis sp. cmx-8-4 TaxID=2790947 RepID=UPI003977EF77